METNIHVMKIIFLKKQSAGLSLHLFRAG